MAWTTSPSGSSRVATPDGARKGATAGTHFELIARAQRTYLESQSPNGYRVRRTMFPSRLEKVVKRTAAILKDTDGVDFRPGFQRCLQRGASKR